MKILQPLQHLHRVVRHDIFILDSSMLELVRQTASFAILPKVRRNFQSNSLEDENSVTVHLDTIVLNDVAVVQH